MAETLREYLIPLGFKVDRVGLDKFNAAVASTAIAVENAVARITDRWTELYYASERIGSSVENINALAFAGKQIGLSFEQSRGAVEGLARALRSNPGIGAFINSMGIKTEGRDRSEVLLDVVKHLKDKYGTGPGFAVGSRIGQMLGVDPDTLLFLEKNYDELNAKMRANKKIFNDAGIDQEATSAKFREFSNTVDALEKKIEALTDSFTVRLLPKLEEFVKDLSQGVDWLTKMDHETNGVSTGIIALAGAFTAWNIAASALKGTLSALGLISGASGGGTAAAAEGSGWIAVLTRLGLIGATASLSGDTRGGGISDAEREAYNKKYDALPAEEKFWPSLKRAGKSILQKLLPNGRQQVSDVDYFRSKGWSTAQAVGIVANIQAESGGDPNQFNPAGGGQGAVGLGQWRGTRIAALKAFAASMGKSYYDRDVQRAFYDYELRNGQGGSQLGSENSATGASTSVLKYFERPAAGDFAAESAKRASIASELLNRYNSYQSAVGGSHVSINQKTDIHVNGGDAASTGRAVASEQGRVNGDMVRNFSGAVQ